MRDLKFEPCNKCEFFKEGLFCIIDKINLYSLEGLKKRDNCKDFILKNLFSKDDIECILKERGVIMRDPNRLDEFYDTLKLLHKNCFPDWRFGQFMSNFLDWILYKKGIDYFYFEEDKMLEYLKEYCKTYSSYFDTTNYEGKKDAD